MQKFIWADAGRLRLDGEKVDEIEQLFEKRIIEIYRYYQGCIPSWGIVNESVDPVPAKPRYGVVPDDYAFKSFKLAEKEFPSSIRFNTKAYYSGNWQELLENTDRE